MTGISHLCGADTSWRWSSRLSVRQHDAVRCCYCAPLVPCTLWSLLSVRVCSQLQSACWFTSSIGAAPSTFIPLKRHAIDLLRTCIRLCVLLGAADSVQSLSLYSLACIGGGVGLLLTLLSSLPLSLNHFFVASSRSFSRSGDGSFRCMKLQKPPRTHPSPLFSRQHASRKSVTGLSSQ